MFAGTVTSDFDPARINFVRVQDRTDRYTVRLNGMELRQALPRDIPAISRALADPHVYRMFGFNRPIPPDYVVQWKVPDGTGTLEAVELLVFEKAREQRALGFVIVYDTPARGAGTQEVDLALFNRDTTTSRRDMRAIRTCTLTYLFAVQGNRAVHWVRSRPVTQDKTRDAQGCVRLQRDCGRRAKRVTPDDFVEMLERFERKWGRARMPVVIAGSDQPAGSERRAQTRAL